MSREQHEREVAQHVAEAQSAAESPAPGAQGATPSLLDKDGQPHETDEVALRIEALRREVEHHIIWL